MSGRGVLAITVGLALSGCQTYVPIPQRLDAYPAALAARSLDEYPTDHAWTSGQLLAAALVRNPQVSQALAAYRTAIASAKSARVRPAVSLTLTVEYSRDASPWLYGGGADIPLDQKMRRAARLSSADLGALQAYYDYCETVWSVRSALNRARVDHLAAEIEIADSWPLAEARQLRADRMDARVEAGEDSRSVALIARSEAATAHHRLADAMAKRDQTNIALANALGVSPAVVANLKFSTSGEPSDPPQIRVSGTQAAQTRRDILRAVADYDLAENALRLEIARQYPEVRLGPGYSWDHGVAKLPFNLALALPPSDMNRAAINQAEAKRAQAGKTLESLQAGIISEIDHAVRAVALARLQLGLARDRDLPAAQNAANAAIRSLRAGEADRTDELAARSTRLEAELALNETQRALAVAKADLQDALRTPFDPEELAVLESNLREVGGGL